VQFDPYTLVLTGLILLGGSILQGTIGFAFGLFAIPLLIIVGLEPYLAISFVGTCALSQAAVGLSRHHKEIEWKQIVWMVSICIAIQPIGVYLLWVITDTLNDGQVRQIFGVILTVFLTAQLLIRPKPREKLHPGWGATAMACSGLLSGMTGMSGPPIVFWVIAHKWSNIKSRATFWAFFVFLIPTNLIFQSLQFGTGVWKASGMAVLFVPVMLLGTLPALWLGKRIPIRVLRGVSIVILFLIAAYAIGQPLFIKQPKQQPEKTKSPEQPEQSKKPEQPAQEPQPDFDSKEKDSQAGAGDCERILPMTPSVVAISSAVI